MSYKCEDCEMLKLPIERGFTNGVCNNICQYMICNNCNRIINKIDDMNNKDIDIRNNETIDDDLEIFVFIKMNNFLTIEGFDIFFMRAMMKEMIMILFLRIIAW